MIVLEWNATKHLFGMPSQMFLNGMQQKNTSAYKECKL